MYVDVTAGRRLGDDLNQSKQELETAYEELQSSNEEMETTNEELQSTIEELETTNEEMQSTNEEMETINEELESTNEELETINNELRERTLESARLNAFLESVLRSLEACVITVDREMNIQAWNQECTEMWGLRLDEVVGRHLLNLDCGLPVKELQQVAGACLAGETEHVELQIDAVNRRGRGIRCKVGFSPLYEASRTISGVILLIQEIPEKSDANRP